MEDNIVGFTMRSNPRTRKKEPTSLGVYDRSTKKEKSSCTLELRVYNPWHFIRGVSHPKFAAKEVKKKLEDRFGENVDDYLTRVEELQRIKHPRNGYIIGILPRLHKKYANDRRCVESRDPNIWGISKCELV